MTDLRTLRKAKLAREDMTAHICDLQDRIAAAQRQPDQEPDWYLGDGVTEPATRSETALVLGIPAAIVLAVLALVWWLSWKMLLSYSGCSACRLSPSSLAFSALQPCCSFSPAS